MPFVRPKKHLGQHFLKDLDLARQVADSLQQHGGYTELLEVGPGTGVLTQFLRNDERFQLQMVEMDIESVDYLQKELGISEQQIIAGDFLKLDLTQLFAAPFGIIGNFPYNISSQIFFKILEKPDLVLECVGMLQKEVAQRIVAGPGGRTCGILSILVQAFYDVEYLFEVPPSAFNPPPKVQSAVIALRRNQRQESSFNKKLFFQLVKLSFGNRRKTLRNNLKYLPITAEYLQDDFFNKRAEELSVDEFIRITAEIEAIADDLFEK